MLITAVMLMALMLGVALSAYALVDQEQSASAGERVRETSFNLAEQLLDAQVYILSRDWPGQGGVVKPTTTAYPSQCASGVTSNRCPNAAGLISRFGGPDVAAGITWSTMVRDNNSPNPNYYDDASTRTAPCNPGGQTPCTYDANNDGRLWVRAQTIVRGKRRTLVGLVKIDTVAEDFPKNAILAGKFGTNNSGRKEIVNTGGAPVQVRCTVQPQSSCMDYPPSKGQITPDTHQPGYTGGDALADEQIDRLRERAIAEGTYYASCPANPSGSLVFVESGNCSYSNSASPCCNSSASPGVFIINSGTLSLSGNIVFYGLVYAPNRGTTPGTYASSDWVVSNTGTSRIEGGVAIDGPGGMQIGSSGNPNNLVYRANVFNNVISYANAGIIQNTWREIPASN